MYDIGLGSIAVETYENALRVGFDPATAMAISDELIQDLVRQRVNFLDEEDEPL